MTHGKTYNKSPRRINHKATKSKTNTRTTALERSVEQTTGGFKALLQLANFTLGRDATLNTEIDKNSEPNLQKSIFVAKLTLTRAHILALHNVLKNAQFWATKKYWLNYFSMKTWSGYALDVTKLFLISTHNICLLGIIRKIFTCKSLWSGTLKCRHISN